MADQHARDTVPTSLLSDLHVSYIQSLDKVCFSLLSLSCLGRRLTVNPPRIELR